MTERLVWKGASVSARFLKTARVLPGGQMLKVNLGKGVFRHPQRVPVDNTSQQKSVQIHHRLFPDGIASCGCTELLAVLQAHTSPPVVLNLIGAPVRAGFDEGSKTKRPLLPIRLRQRNVPIAWHLHLYCASNSSSPCIVGILVA